ncbi:DUF4251 domain-containing protein [Persicobacter diffluens]|uniref:DUF4251 domain-containing protein n=1 Tax=Persicobacter diffluens TaxID=981 RepID=A0AAN4W152_9BACT|nr:hypothetical protein PEDI_37390 [Persicobacter diffluens]
MKYLLIILSLISLNFLPATAQEKLSRKERKKMEKEKLAQQTHSLVMSGKFVFNVEQVSPLRGRTLNVVTDNYTLTFNGPEAIAYLPYFGRAFSASYGSSEGGIKFNQKKQNEKMEIDEKKDRKTISFDINEGNEQYQCYLEIFSNGSGALRIKPQNKDAISYTGKIAPLPEKQK